MKTQVLSTTLLAGLLCVAQASCGGSQADSDLQSTPESASDAGIEAPAAPVTFVLTNSGSDSLFINMDKGWQAVIYAYSGTPPNAKPMVMFPPHCTASCDAAAEDLCPVCEAPKQVKAIKAAEQHDEVMPGDSREVTWDVQAFSSKRTKKGKRNGKRVSCNCFNTVEAVPETYTIKACALRKTQSAKTRSKYQCVESTLTLPITDPVKVELDFGA